jgi:hypothetical protein
MRPRRKGRQTLVVTARASDGQRTTDRVAVIVAG